MYLGHANGGRERGEPLDEGVGRHLERSQQAQEPHSRELVSILQFVHVLGLEIDPPEPQQVLDDLKVQLPAIVWHRVVGNALPIDGRRKYNANKLLVVLPCEAVLEGELRAVVAD